MENYKWNVVYEKIIYFKVFFLKRQKKIIKCRKYYIKDILKHVFDNRKRKYFRIEKNFRL